MSYTKSRRYPRFEVAFFTKLQARLLSERRGDQLIDVSLGGCGFYSSHHQILNAGEPASCIFYLENITPNPLQVNGRIVYRNTQSFDQKKVHYYGIQFEEDQTESLTGIIEYLETMAEVGSVTVN